MPVVHDTTINAQGQIVTRKHSSILSKSLLIAGIAFIAIFGFSFGLYKLLWSKYGAQISNNTVIALYVISILMLIGSIIMVVIVLPRIMKVKLATLISLVILYSIANGISFALLFYAIKQTNHVIHDSSFQVGDICWCFLISGAIFLITGFLGTLLSVRYTLSLAKFLMIATMVFMVCFLVFFIINIFTQLTTTTFIIIYGIWGFLMILYIMFDFSMIKKSQPFISIQENSIQTKFVWMFGFTLLVDLIQLVWVAIRLYLITRK